LIFLLLRSS